MAKLRLPDLDPLTREQVAAWIEYMAATHAQHADQAQALIGTPQEGHDTKGQVAYWRACLSFGKFLAYRIRVARTKKLVSPSEPPPKQ
jgi:hypothetical protein